MKDQSSARLPADYSGLKRLQQQFKEYQERAFPSRPARFFSLELCGEVGEIANLEKKKWKNVEVAPGDLAEEAADATIALLNYANARGIDLAAEVERKMSKIEEKRRRESGRGD